MLPTPSDNYFFDLLNQSPATTSQLPVLATAERTIKVFPDCIYHSYKSLGLAFCFTAITKPINECDPNDPVLRLNAIDIYNGTTKDGFQTYQGDLPLPCGVTPAMQAHELVSLLGEPNRKGGGGRVPCWIDYKFERGGGLMIQLHGIDWEDRTMGWSSLVLYQ
ncbi:hypothetical protein DM01DRAFT_1367465 [Hesseltinella vesiculosa]|uniref:Uncharacterized protein n=1 Tax=Hesseltinella vesiculosa TaxID=101127 RepID=A0A1X2GF13_9FUNG|nr:hypothetical protein DM01DRAFT_1367465 [Hesseltinella vesiculosa]